MNAKTLGMLVAAFVAGSFVASPELRAYAAATIGSADIIDGSIQSADIGNGQVKASDIATDAVGASEIKGVSKLIFAECKVSVPAISPLAPFAASCHVQGASDSDRAIVALKEVRSCLDITSSDGGPQGQVTFLLANRCETNTTSETLTFAVIVFHP